MMPGMNCYISSSVRLHVEAKWTCPSTSESSSATQTTDLWSNTLRRSCIPLLPVLVVSPKTQTGVCTKLGVTPTGS